MALRTSIDIGPELMDALEKRYQSGEISKNTFLIERGKLQARIDRGQAIRRTPAGLVLKWVLVVLLLAMVVATWYFFTPGFVGWIMAAVELGGAVWVAVTP
jgi:hypothetical protein